MVFQCPISTTLHSVHDSNIQARQETLKQRVQWIAQLCFLSPDIPTSTTLCGNVSLQCYTQLESSQMILWYVVTISALCASNFPFLQASTLPKQAAQSLPTTRLLILMKRSMVQWPYETLMITNAKDSLSNEPWPMMVGLFCQRASTYKSLMNHLQMCHTHLLTSGYGLRIT